MSINSLIFRNLKKNLKNYYLYVFALVFTVALYFAFVTLQYDPAMDETKGTIKGAASIRAASVLLVGIVTVFLLFANNIFIKRRSKEIGLFQLIGMTKSRIFRILTAENCILYFCSMAIGIFIGFSFSKLIMMILFKILQIELEASLNFSSQAFYQTVGVFSLIYLLIMCMNYAFIKRQSILSLFRVTSSTETRVKKLSVWEILMGIMGIGLIATGYYVSSRLFSGDITEMNKLFMAMIFILGSVIIGTYFFYKGSVSFVFQLIRKMKDGYLTVNEVLSLSSIMFRMKSNALLLTIITTVSALAIGLLSLSYISYYSAEESARKNIAADFAFVTQEDARQFTSLLEENTIPFTKKEIPVIQVPANLEEIMLTEFEGGISDSDSMQISVISEESVKGAAVAPDETYFTGYHDALQKFMPLKDAGNIELKGKNLVISQSYLGMRNEHHISWYFTSGGTPVAIVDHSVFEKLEKDLLPEIQKKSSLFTGITLKHEEKLEEANELFLANSFSERNFNDSRLQMSIDQKMTFGLIMFIVGFLGLTFLITSGCILYFKQMDESEDEKPNYTILRKLGFTRNDLLKGIQAKQLFNFGIPLAIGLLHSYFAVQSGWFFFGTELWTPMIMVMVLYTVLYSIFGLLSIMYYRKVIKEAL
ncbi:bacitracin ABC transporter permease [Bacillus sp. FJAT-18017]|uniref:FtsX-like permease family protein n=1 Tax=Bacillus sp. FJAT-18017 TaxID=1705566 RepID=UPI0006ADF39C|nr:ABC transporter permease [Bacillus sp. FJAT-18017]ALC88585.1 bacitracin ABC transporter permease [Bacillus sp. FJAT-18017]